MKRRAALYGGAAAAAGLCGAGAAWWRLSQRGAATLRSRTASDAFWRLGFETPTGAPLSAAGFRGKPLLVNFWATWCPPCVEELPLLDSFYRSFKAGGWQVLGLAVDQPGIVRNWLRARPVQFPIGIAGFAGFELSKGLGNHAGSLPFSVVFLPDGQLGRQKIGRLSVAELDGWVNSIGRRSGLGR